MAGCAAISCPPAIHDTVPSIRNAINEATAMRRAVFNATLCAENGPGPFSPRLKMTLTAFCSSLFQCFQILKRGPESLTVRLLDPVLSELVCRRAQRADDDA